MSNEQDPLAYIVQQLEDKSCVKQQTYRNLLTAFGHLHTLAEQLAQEINQRFSHKDRGVTIEVMEVNSHEFHLKVAGDLLVFFLHTNVITFEPEHYVMNSEYMEEDPLRKYFGQIMVYNFMADSVKFNRLNDPGYLLGRILINHENRFFIEGERQLGFLFKEISDQPIRPVDLNIFIKIALVLAIDNDLVTPPYPSLRAIRLVEKMDASQQLGAGNKIGFQMKLKNKPAS
jgi:hypothetical protein